MPPYRHFPAVPAVHHPRGRFARRLRRRVSRAAHRLVLRNPLWDGTTAPAVPGRRGAAGRGAPLLLAVLGDSTALTVGVTRPEHTVAVVLADALAAELDCPVDVRVTARAGATTASMTRQVRAVACLGPGVAIVQIGGNDVFAPTNLRAAAVLLARHVDLLRAHGWQVVVTSCPCVDATAALRGWARPVGRRRSRRLAALQTAAALRAGAAVVSLSAPESRSWPPSEQYCPDGFHPSPAAYRLFQDRALPAVLEAGRAVRSGTAPGPDGASRLREHGALHESSVAAAMREVHEHPGASFFPRSAPGESAQRVQRLDRLPADGRSGRTPAAGPERPPVGRDEGEHQGVAGR